MPLTLLSWNLLFICKSVGANRIKVSGYLKVEMKQVLIVLNCFH